MPVELPENPGRGVLSNGDESEGGERGMTRETRGMATRILFLSARRVLMHERTPMLVARGNAKWSRLLSWMGKGDIGKRRRERGAKDIQ